MASLERRMEAALVLLELESSAACQQPRLMLLQLAGCPSRFDSISSKKDSVARRQQLRWVAHFDSRCCY